MIPELPAGQASRIRDLLARGDKINAIKEYRDLTGSDLAEAKRAVENLATAHQPAPEKTARENLELNHRVIDALQRQGTIQAIKVYRQEMRCELREAKLAVDRIASENGIRPRPRGCLGLAVFLCGFLLFALFAIISRYRTG